MQPLSVRIAILAAVGCLLECPPTVCGDDWPMWGRDQTRNMVSPEKNPPTDWQVPVKDDASVSARNIKWSARLGSSSRGTPVVAGGLVWVGTNNQNPRDPKQKEDASVLMCFRESDGKFLWQYVSPRLRNVSRSEDSPRHSMGSSPLVEGDRLWLITNRCETVCLDIGPVRPGEGGAREIWKVDMRKEFGVVPRAPLMAMGFSPSVAGYQDRIYVVTGNGVDETEEKVPAPRAPSLICFSKNTGKAIWSDNSPGTGILDSQRSSPLVLDINGRGQAIIGQGDGWLRSFDALTGKLLWQCDLNRKDAKGRRGRRSRKYVMATPVFYQNRIYIATGQDPSLGGGEGCLFCIDPTRQGDISLELKDTQGQVKPNPSSGVLWHTRSKGAVKAAAALNRDYLFGSTMSTCAVQDGLLYAADAEGYLHCFDAQTGRLNWQHDPRTDVWGSPLWVDGKVYMATTDGDVFVFNHGKEKREPKAIAMDESIYTTPVFANGVLYVIAGPTLYAIQQPRSAPARRRTPLSIFVPTPHDVVAKMLELADVKKTDVVYDLGSGDGRIVIAAAKKYGCRAIGYELDKELIKESRGQADKSGLAKLVTFEAKDFLTADLRNADVVALYLVPRQLETLLPQLEKLKPGARIVSHQFAIPGVKPEKVQKLLSSEDEQFHSVYLWTTPLKKERE